MAPASSAVYHVTIAIRDTEESRASAGEPSCRSRHSRNASAAPRSALPRLSGSGLFRARSSPGSSSPGSAAPRRSRRPLERGRRTCGTAKEGAICCRFFGRLPRGMARGARARLEKLRRPARRCPPAFGGARRRAGARAGCGCSATSSVVPDGSGAFYHQPLPRLPPSAPSLGLSEAAF